MNLKKLRGLVSMNNRILILVVATMIIIISSLFIIPSLTKTTRVIIKVGLEGNNMPWEIGYGDYDGVRRYSGLGGTGNQSFIIDRTDGPFYLRNWTVYAEVTKKQNSTYLLIVTIEKPDGTILAQGSTRDYYGIVRVSYSTG